MRFREGQLVRLNRARALQPYQFGLRYRVVWTGEFSIGVQEVDTDFDFPTHMYSHEEAAQIFEAAEEASAA